MDHEKEICRKLAKQNVDIIVKAIEEGKVEPDQIKVIAHRMNGSVHGTFTSYIGKDKLVNVFLKMLDTWYVESLHKIDDGLSKFKEILRHERVGLSHLAYEMTHSPDQASAIVSLFEDEKYQGPRKRTFSQAKKEKNGRNRNEEKFVDTDNCDSSPLILNDNNSTTDLSKSRKDNIKKWVIILLGILLCIALIAIVIIATLGSILDSQLI